MHLSPGLLDGPTTWATSAAALGSLGYALRQVTLSSPAKFSARNGASIAAFVFAVQTWNFAVTHDTSTHFLGGALAGILLGPWAGILACAAAVLCQALLFADGGLDVLGANLLNLAIIGPCVGHFAFQWLGQGRLQSRFALRAGLAGGLAVAAATLACAAQLYWGTPQVGGQLALELWTAHLPLAFAEGIFTAVAVLAWNKLPRSLPSAHHPRHHVTLAVVLVVLVAGAGLSSGMPDILEHWSSAAVGDTLESSWSPWFSGYAFPRVNPAWIGTVLASLIGVVGIYSLVRAMFSQLQPAKVVRHRDGVPPPRFLPRK